MVLPQEDIEDIVSELLTWVLEKVSTVKTRQTDTSKDIPFISDKLISMFISSYIRHKYHEIPFTSFDNENSNTDDVVEYLTYTNVYVNNTTDNIDINEEVINDEDKQVESNTDIDDFQIFQIVDMLMNKLEDYKRKDNKTYNDSKLVVNKNIIKKYLYLLLRYRDMTITNEYKNTLSTGKKYRLEKNLELLSTIV